MQGMKLMQGEQLPPDAAAFLLEAALSVVQRHRGGALKLQRGELAQVIEQSAQEIGEAALRRQGALIEQLIAPKPTEGVERLLGVLEVRIYHEARRIGSYEEEREQLTNLLTERTIPSIL